MMSFITSTANLGTTAPLQKRARKSQSQNVTNMRQDLVERAEATIKALKKYSGGRFEAPMCKSIRNGLSVKLGYGKSNVAFLEGPKDNRTPIIPDRHFARDDKLVAIDYLQKAIAAVKVGELDGLLQDRLETMSERSPSKRKKDASLSVVK
jgi:hypothetical protein